MLVRRTPTTRWIDRFFDDMRREMSNFEPSDEFNADYSLALDVDEEDDAYVVSTSIPGVKADDIHVSLNDNVLTISAEVQDNRESEDNNGKRVIRERHYGKFSRSVRFPVPVNSEAVEADYDNGVLTLNVPKSENVKPRTISVKAKS
ncbi:Hsp20/alpha crystallin family protein [Phototrophicus methaneseepsis]|uniref:Hsp20/alpha crystallin family protein n=1 Tax=Phototrophicus methaneseepsis TaxID=2710758 RepID=A0A7S8IE41_9CHLR|nr:Hsp20/alpha crystallin family protein [Phototrophicus methaneseepsis]QPC82216.1 Hsp20/alpha crystallin family protein [Phototrophicus methaneseepsis]